MGQRWWLDPRSGSRQVLIWSWRLNPEFESGARSSASPGLHLMAWWEQWLMVPLVIVALMIRGLPLANSFNDWMKRKSEQRPEDDDPRDDAS